MQKIGIFGGTFNPVHAEHVNVAKNAIKELGLDKLYVMPTFITPNKNTAPVSAFHRVEMLKLAFLGVDKVEISDFEIKKGGKSYTFETIEHFSSENVELFFIVGGDMLTDFKTWKNPERILAKANLAVFEREGYITDFEGERQYFLKRFNKEFIKLSYVGKNLSSTKIRVYSALGIETLNESIDKVTEYITENGLYIKQDYLTFLKNNLTKKRLLHTANVAVLALKKAKELSLDVNKVFTACILHDVAKYLDPKDFLSFELEKDMPAPVIHAFLGAFVAEYFLGVEDRDIINAIKYHTTGRRNMSDLEKLVFVADMLEEGRTYEGVERLRSFYDKDLDTCFIECLKEEIEHLKNKGQKIYYLTIEAFNYYVKGE